MLASESAAPAQDKGASMPRYFFHVHDGANIDDEVGELCEDLEQAQHEAIRIPGDIISDNAKKMKLGETWAMEVTDEDALILFHLDFYVGNKPRIRWVGRRAPTSEKHARVSAVEAARDADKAERRLGYPYGTILRTGLTVTDDRATPQRRPWLAGGPLQQMRDQNKHSASACSASWRHAIWKLESAFRAAHAAPIVFVDDHSWAASTHKEPIWAEAYDDFKAGHLVEATVLRMVEMRPGRDGLSPCENNVITSCVSDTDAERPPKGHMQRRLGRTFPALDKVGRNFRDFRLFVKMPHYRWAYLFL
jgi:hypothetical protein